MERHRRHLLRAIELARLARAKGNHPFGSLLVDPATDAVVWEAQNTVLTQKDCTGHAETNLVREAVKNVPPAVLKRSILYTSTEPCAMCSGAIYWSGISHVVFALPEEELRGIAGPPTLALPCREIFARGTLPVLVEGPYLVEEARKVHDGFWEVHVNGPRRA